MIKPSDFVAAVEDKILVAAVAFKFAAKIMNEHGDWKKHAANLLFMTSRSAKACLLEHCMSAKGFCHYLRTVLFHPRTKRAKRHATYQHVFIQFHKLISSKCQYIDTLRTTEFTNNGMSTTFRIIESGGLLILVQGDNCVFSNTVTLSTRGYYRCTASILGMVSKNFCLVERSYSK